MKIYAKQVPPEYQESPLFLGDEFFPDDIAVYGNRNYNEHCPAVFTRVFDALDCCTLLDVWDDLQSGYGYNSWIDALDDLVPPTGREAYTRAERLRWHCLAFEYYNASRGSYEKDRALCEALELVTGEAWETGTIRGCCQGDWQNVCYPVAAWSREALEEFETEYFNTGSEWIIHDEDTEPESPEDVSGCSMYCHGWNDDLIRAEIANNVGCSPEDVILYSFTGWSRSACYKEV